MKDWKEVKLGEITINGKGEYGIGAPSVDYNEDLYTYLRITDINEDGTLDKLGFKSVSDEKANNYLLYPNDIVFARTGNSTGKSYFYNEKDGDLVYAGFLIKFSLDANKINPKYLKYFTHTQQYYDWVRSVDNGATRANINAQMYAEMPVTIPSRKEQDAWVSMLSSLDDKIELLNQQNQTLEQLAETLFRQWFIEEAEEDWEEKSLSAVAEYLNGLACQKYPAKDTINRLPVLKIRELREGITENSDWASTDIDDIYKIENGDVIFSWSASLLVKIWDGGNCILNQHLFKVSSNDFPKWFYYLWTKFHLTEFISIAQSHATTMGHIKRSDLDEAMALVPSKLEIENMSNTFNPILEKTNNNNLQIQTLTTLRETLLPKLMSGEVRVKMN